MPEGGNLIGGVPEVVKLNNILRMIFSVDIMLYLCGLFQSYETFGIAISEVHGFIL